MTYRGMFVCAVVATLIAACGSTEPSESALLSMTIVGVDAEARSVSGIVSNESEVEFYHGPCFAELQHRQSGEWSRAEPNATCPLPLVALKPGDQAEFSVGPGIGSSDCDYRIVATVRASLGSEGAGETVTVASDPFCFN